MTAIAADHLYWLLHPVFDSPSQSGFATTPPVPRASALMDRKRLAPIAWIESLPARSRRRTEWTGFHWRGPDPRPTQEKTILQSRCISVVRDVLDRTDSAHSRH